MARADNPGYVPPEKRLTPHDRAVRSAAEETLHWIKIQEFERDVSAVSRAMKNAGLTNNADTRDQVWNALRELPEWKEMKQKEREDREHKKVADEIREEEHVKQAYAHQMRQPRDTWDNAYDPLEDNEE